MKLHFPNLGKVGRCFFQALEKTTFALSKPWKTALLAAIFLALPAFAVENPKLSVVKVDSAEKDSKGANAVDGNPDTLWHTQWQQASPAHPHWIIIKLNPPCKIKGLTYLPRQDGSENGMIKDYEIFVSTDGKDFGQPIKKGVFAGGQERKLALFEAKQCGFIKLVALSEVNGGPLTSAAEIGVLTLSTPLAQSKVVEAIVPTAKKPFNVPTNAEAKKKLESEIQDYMGLPPEVVHAHPAAANYPGTAPATAKRVTRVITVHGPQAHAPATAMYADWNQDWQSTGLYAQPGEVVTVTPLAPLPKGMTVQVQIGCHTDCPWDQKQWIRFPTLVRSFVLTQGATPVANAFGGPLLVSVKQDSKELAADLKIELRFANAVQAPYFVLGKTSMGDWKKVQNAAAPWGELVGHNLILHIPVVEARKLNDPTPLLEWWDKVVAAEDSLAGWPARTAQERVVFERQKGGAWGHSGYPVMIDIEGAKGAADLLNLRKNGDWGLFHELGHNHQSDAWTFGEKEMDNTEVTVNFFSIYVMEKIVGKTPDQTPEQHVGRELLKALDRRLGHPASQDPFDILAPFVVLLHKYGWAPLHKTLASYQTDHVAPNATLVEKQAEFVRRYSHNAKANLTGIFKRMDYACPKSLCDELKDLPAFDFAAWRKEYAAKHKKG